MMNKTAVWIALVALAGGVSAQDLEQRVSYSGSATTAKRLLETLGTQAGLLLSTSPQTANEVLVVKVDNVKLVDLLKHIADACSAEWKQETGGYRLIRPEALAREQDRADLAARTKAFEAPLRRLVEGVNKIPSLDEAQARRMAEEARQVQENALQGGRMRLAQGAGASSSRSPAARALVRLLESLTPATLAGIAPNTRVVFASSPNRMQKALGPKTNAILTSMVQEHNAYARALAETPREATPPNTRVMILGGPDLNARTIDRVGKALVVFTRGADKALSAELKVADASGAIVAQASEFLTPDATPTPPGTNDAGKPLVLSEQAREYATLMAGPALDGQSDGQRVVRISMGGGANMMWSSGATPVPAVSDEWKQRLSQPEKFEPHEFVAGQALRETAAGEGRNLVANVPDDALIPVCRRLLNARMTPMQFLGFLSTNMDMAIEREEGWLLIAPRHPSEVRDARVDRAPLGTLLRQALKTGYARLDEMAAYALKQPEGLPDGAFDERTIRLLSPDAGQDFEFNGSDRRAMLKLYGLMGAPQRQMLLRGGSIRLGALDPRQGALVHNMVFNSATGPSIREPGGGNQGQQRPQPGGQQQQVIAIAQGPGGGGSPMPAFSRSFDTSLIQERTEALPTGIPGDGVLTLRVGQQQGVLGMRADGSDARFLSADQLAGDLIASGNPELAAITGGGSSPYAKFRAATLTQFDFQFQFSALAQMGRQLRDAEIAAGAPTAAFEDLPQSFRNQVLQIVRRMEEMSSRLGNVTARPGRRGGSPPPP